MRILMTGANGFVGSALCQSLGTSAEVVAVGRSAPPRTEHIHVDLAAPGALAQAISLGKLPSKVDVVVHLAVSKLHRTFPATALDLFEVNVSAAANLLDYARRAGAQHFVLGSTGSIYDGLKVTPLRETDAPIPRRYFPVTKFAAEMLTREYDSLFGASILRFFTPYGPGQGDRLVPGLIERVRGRKPVTLPESGDGLSFATLYVSDAVEVTKRAILERWRGTFNVASPETQTIRSAAEIIARVLGTDALFERQASAPNYVLMPDLAALQKQMAGYRFTTFEDGIRMSVAVNSP